jgi:Fic family protein
MPAFFDLLREEPHPGCPRDGNGRVGRFLMNTMMASGGYRWTVIPVTDRNAYVNALEKSECWRGYLALHGLPRRAGEKTTDG